MISSILRAVTGVGLIALVVIAAIMVTVAFLLGVVAPLIRAVGYLRDGRSRRG